MKSDLLTFLEPLVFQDICVDSRFVKRGDLFVCLPSTKDRFRHFTKKAEERGCAGIISFFSADGNETVPFLHDPCIQENLIFLCHWFYGDPWKSMTNIAVTGTNGKTSVSYMIEALLQKNQKKVGVIGTVNYRVNDVLFDSESYTTPPLSVLYRLGREFQKKKVEFSMIEASSHGITQGRLQDIPVKIAIFTNLTRDHLDYHKTYEDYFASKKKLFDQLRSLDFAVVNRDDPYSQKIIKNCRATVLSYGFSAHADIRCMQFSSSRIRVQFLSDKKEYYIKHSFLGRHNVLNLLASLTVAFILKIDFSIMKKAFEKKILIPGRLERYFVNDKFCFVDYAHTPDALKNVLQCLRELYPQNPFWIVLGCGGNRDQGKRPTMGKIAEKYTDNIILSSDNPRYEDPFSIIKDILSGISQKSKVLIIEERKKAILTALSRAKKGSVILIVGKGHESYQEIFGIKIMHSDRILLECS